MAVTPEVVFTNDMFTTVLISTSKYGNTQGL